MTTEPPSQRRSGLTTNVLLSVVLVVQASLFLSQCSQFGEKGSPNDHLLTVAFNAMIWALLWFAGMLMYGWTQGRWPQYDLKTLMLLVAIVAIPLGWMGIRSERTRRIQELVRLIEESGCNFESPIEKYPLPTTLFPSFVETFVPEIRFYDESDRAIAVSVHSREALKRLHELPKLREIRFRNNQFGDEELAAIANLKNLTHLAIDNTQTTDAGLRHLRGMTKLKLLNLRFTQISDEGLRHLAGQTELESLNLRWTNVTDDGLTHIKHLTKIERLNLFHTPITDASIEGLILRRNLKWIDVARTRISLKGLQRFEAVLPECELIDDRIH